MSAETALLEWRRAQASLGAAGSCRRDGYYADTVSRAYYAVLHGARAGLELDGYSTETHRATRNLFGRNFVRTGRVEPEWARIIRELSDARIDADYKINLTFDSADADAAYTQAGAFLNRIHEFLTVTIPAGQL